MTNVEWVRKFGEPNSVSGMNVDWSGYIPSGGWNWQDNFRSNISPAIDCVLSGLEKEKSKYESAQLEYDELATGSEKAAKFFSVLKDAVCKYPGAMSVFGDKADPFMKQWLAMSGNMMNVIGRELKNMSMDPDLVKDIEQNISFIRSFRDYITMDFEFDMLMWAQHNCDSKYFKKLFRTSFKKLKQIQEVRNIVENCKLDFACKVRDRFSQAISNLHEAYSYLEPLIRKYKKVVDDPAFMPKSVSTDFFAKNYEKGSHGWDIVNCKGLF